MYGHVDGGLDHAETIWIGLPGHNPCCGVLVVWIRSLTLIQRTGAAAVSHARQLGEEVSQHARHVWGAS
jgi:hypothetical protein